MSDWLREAEAPKNTKVCVIETSGWKLRWRIEEVSGWIHLHTWMDWGLLEVLSAWILRTDVLYFVVHLLKKQFTC